MRAIFISDTYKDQHLHDTCRYVSHTPKLYRILKSQNLSLGAISIFKSHTDQASEFVRFQKVIKIIF